MYHKLATSLTSYFIGKTGEKRDDFEILVYGAELFLSSVVNTIFVLVIGFVFGCLLEALLFLAFFCPLRKYSGGFHASTYWSCSLIFCLYFALICYFVGDIPFVWRLIIAVFDVIVVLLLTPVEDPNKPIRGKRKEKIIVRTRITLVIEVVLFGAAQFLPVPGRWLGFITAAFATSAVLLILGAIKNRMYKKKV